MPRALRGRILLQLALSFSGGIAACYFLRPALKASLLVLAGSLLIVLIFGIRDRFTRWQPLLLLGLSVGFFLAAAQYDAINAWPLPQGEYAEISGVVKGVPALDGEGGYRLRLTVDRVEGERVRCADIYLYGQGEPPRPHSRVTAEGRCMYTHSYANAHAFDYQAYLQQQGIAARFSTVYKGWLRVDKEGPALSGAVLCQWLRGGFDQALAGLGPQQQALVKGVFLGDDSDLDGSLRQQVELSGMAHVFAVSGLHVGYIIMLAQALCGSHFRRRKLRFGLTAALLLLYLSLTGWAASLVRASVMALFLLLADLFLEENDPLTALAGAALVCLSFRPLWLFSAGFQMSFAAVWAMYVLGPPLSRLLPVAPEGWKGALISSWAYSLAALLGVGPLVCYYFFYLPWWGWLLAPLVVFGAGVAVILALAGLLASVFSIFLASLFLEGSAWAMQALAWCARGLTGLRISGYGGGLSAPVLLLIYGLLLVSPLVLRRWRLGRPAFVALLAAALLIPLVFSGQRLERGVIAEVTFLDVGQGDCALLRTAEGRVALIDGGGRPASPGYIGEYVLLPYLRSLGIDHLDLLVNSHPDADHTDGLISVLEELSVDSLLYCEAAGEEANAALLTAAEDNGCEAVPAWAGESYLLGEGARLSIYSPQPHQTYADSNAASLVLLLQTGETEILFCGDARGELLAQVCGDNDLTCDVVKLPHHGSVTGYDRDFYEQIEAELALVSVGEGNSYGHPHADVVEYWQEQGQLYRTDLDGAVTLSIGGEGYVVSTEK